MYGLNAVALVFFGCINVLAYKLCKCPVSTRKKVISVLCAALLSGNLIRYIVIYPLIIGTIMIPVEFSTVAYFAVPTILLISKKRLHGWAAYSGLMAGFFYYMAMIISGGPIYAEFPAADVFISMFCHGSIYFCGFVTISSELCSTKEAPSLAVGVILVAVNALVLRPFVAGNDGLLIYILLDGAIIHRFLPQSAWVVAMPAYYLTVAALVLITIRGFFRRNKRQFLKFCTA